MRFLLYIACLAAFAGVRCSDGNDVSPGTSAASTRPAAGGAVGRTHLRVADDLDAGSIGVERVVTRPRESDIAYIDSPGPITLTLPDGESHDLEPDLIQVRQRGGRMTHLAIFFPNQTLEPAISSALALAEEWSVPFEPNQEQFDRWVAHRRKHGTLPSAAYSPGFAQLSGLKDARYPRKIEIRPSFKSDEPWYVKIVIALYIPEADEGTR